MISQKGNYTTIMLGELISNYTHQLHINNCWGINCVIIPAPMILSGPNLDVDGGNRALVIGFSWSRVLGRGCDEAESNEEKRLFTEWGPGIQWMKVLVRNSTEKTIQWRGFSHSVNRWTLKIEIFCTHPLPKSPLLFWSRPIFLKAIWRHWKWPQLKHDY